MKKLTAEEIKEFAEYLCFTDADAKEITDLFYRLKSDGSWQIGTPLDTVEDYVWEWEGHWHRETNWQEYYEYEKEQYLYCYADTEEEAEEIFGSTETFKSKVAKHSYELTSGLIVIVC